MQTEINRKLEKQYSYQTNSLKNEDCYKDKEGHYIMIKGSIQEDTTIVNIYAFNSSISV